MENEINITLKDTTKLFENPKKYKIPNNIDYYTGNSFEKRYSSNCNNDLKVFIIRDSFSENLIPFLSTNFKESIYIWDNWEYKLMKDYIIKEKPDIVMTILWENYIEKLVDNIMK